MLNASGSLDNVDAYVKDVREGYECGIALANYQDIQKGDVIECFEMERQVATL